MTNNANTMTAPATMPSSRPLGRWAAPLAVAVVCTLGLVLLWSSVMTNLAKDRRIAEGHLENQTANLARALEEHTLSTVRNIDQTLTILRRIYVENRDDFPKYHSEVSRSFNSRMVLQTGVIGADGFLEVSDLPEANRIDLSDRDHFLVPRDNPRDDLYISVPVFGRSSGKWTIQFARRITKSNGDFGGVLVVSVDPNYFAEFYGSINIGTEGSSGLVGKDRFVRARATGAIGEASGLGTVVPADRPYFDPSQPEVGNFRATSVIDGTHRMFSWRRLADYPLIVLITASIDESFAEFEASRRSTIFWVALASVVIAIFAIALIVMILRQHAARVRLELQAVELRRLNAEYLLEREAATKANEAKSDFLSNISHELRTPLNSIIGFSQLMVTDPATDAMSREGAATIHKSGQHLLSLINDVLDLAKIEDRHVELSIEPVDVASLIKEAVSIVAPLAEKHAVTIAKTDIVGSWVRADRVRLKQIILNLLSNAIKYNRPSGRVAIEAVSEREGTLRIRVSDTGRGIPSDRLAELFKPFNRLGAEATGIEGSGIGLALSRRLAEMMNGSIGVESVAGEGSRFWIDLPSVGAPMRAGISPENQSATGSTRAAPMKSIVYVEDSPANVDLVRRIVRRLPGVELIAAHHPRLGIDLIKAHRPALVLLDLNMPEMDGFDVLRTIKADPTTRDIPAIAVTAAAMPSDVAKGKAAGFADYVTKPLDIGKFLATLRAHIEDRH